MEKTVSFDWQNVVIGTSHDDVQRMYPVRMLTNGEPLTLVRLDTEEEARAVCNALQTAYFAGKMGGLAVAMDTLHRVGGTFSNG